MSSALFKPNEYTNIDSNSEKIASSPHFPLADQSARACAAPVSPAKAGDQNAHNQGAQQTSDSEDRDGQRVHEGQVLLRERRSRSIYHCLVVKVLYVLKIGEAKVKSEIIYW